VKGIAKQRKMSAAFGPKWWDRNDHTTFWGLASDFKWETWGSDEFGQSFLWPRPCALCVSFEGDAVTAGL
jgi:hypothetical protein